MTDAKVRVVLVNYRSEDNIAARLSSAALAEADVIVVDNASDPERVVALCQVYGATPVLLSENRGFAAGVNAAWRVARERPPLPLLLLNPDAAIEPDALEVLMTYLGSFDGVGPLLLEARGRPQVGAGGGPLSLPSVAAYFLLFSHVFRRWQGVFLTRRQARRGGRVAWLCMASLLLAPDAMERFGEIPEDEVVYAEDIAWGTAATKAGARFLLEARAVVEHPHGASGASDAWQGALERLLARRLGRARGALATATVRVGLAVRRRLRGWALASGGVGDGCPRSARG